MRFSCTAEEKHSFESKTAVFTENQIDVVFGRSAVNPG
jgi:hypothetical protein